jgi:sulfur relay (sulfurtransferase) complex TusBCD TusD component (DsrE family)
MQVHLCDNCYDRRGLPLLPDNEMTPARLGGRGIR